MLVTVQKIKSLFFRSKIPIIIFHEVFKTDKSKKSSLLQNIDLRLESSKIFRKSYWFSEGECQTTHRSVIGDPSAAASTHSGPAKIHKYILMQESVHFGGRSLTHTRTAPHHTEISR